MVTVVIPGFSEKNKDWALSTAEQVKLSHEVRPILWEHWENPDMPFDPKDKASEIIDVLMGSEVNIIAKSIGTLVASYIINTYNRHVQKIIFNGIPFNDINESDKEVIKEALRDFPVEQILIIQNEEDPHGSYAQAKDFIMGIDSRIKVVKKDRNDHEYSFYSEFEQFLKS